MEFEDSGGKEEEIGWRTEEKIGSQSQDPVPETLPLISDQVPQETDFEIFLENYWGRRGGGGRILRKTPAE